MRRDDRAESCDVASSGEEWTLEPTRKRRRVRPPLPSKPKTKRRAGTRKSAAKARLKASESAVIVDVGGVEECAVLETFACAQAAVPTDYPSLRPGLEPRLVTVDWLAEVAAHLGMRDTTWALAVTLLDRYCAHSFVRQGRLQAAGIAALFIASKHEERVPVRVAKLVKVCKGMMKNGSVLDLEKAMLNAVEWKVAVPHALSVVEAAHSGMPRAALPAARYAAAVALCDAHLAAVPPPLVVAAAVSVGCVLAGGALMHRAPWSPAAVRGVGRRLLRVWRHLVALHDAGNAVYIVRERADDAARIFPPLAEARLAGAFGDDVVGGANGNFAEWAAQQDG